MNLRSEYSVRKWIAGWLTEQAIAAARKLKFEPAVVKGTPASKTITIDYSFEIY